MHSLQRMAVVELADIGFARRTGANVMAYLVGGNMFVHE